MGADRTVTDRNGPDGKGKERLLTKTNRKQMMAMEVNEVRAVGHQEVSR